MQVVTAIWLVEDLVAALHLALCSATVSLTGRDDVLGDEKRRMIVDAVIESAIRAST